MRSLENYILEASSNDVYVYIEIPHEKDLPHVSASSDVVFTHYSKTFTKKAHVYKLYTNKSHDEIEEVFKKVNPTSSKEMGLIMKEITPLVKGKADMSLVSKLIKDKLSSL